MIKLQEWQARRLRLARDFSQDGVAVFFGQSLVLRNGDVHYPFRQLSDLMYLAPINEPDVVLVLHKTTGGVRSYAFCPPWSEKQAMWEGPRVDQYTAIEAYGVDDAFALEDLDAWMEQHIGATGYMISSQEVAITSRWPTLSWQSVDEVLHRARLIKSASEIEVMRRAAKITVAGHLKAMREVRHLKDERSLEGVMMQGFHQAGARETAYASIVASGAHACTLHYTKNDASWGADDLVLIDAGIEVMGYAADVTRTYPVSGRFTAEQKALYEVVYAAQKAVIEAIRPGVTWRDLEQIAGACLQRGLSDLGVLPDEAKDYRRLYPHSIGHWLGLDVHDVGGRCDASDQPIPFEAGMVLTVEPGLYCSETSDVEAKWRGIGIRIEDDVLVTTDGCEVLTNGLPKSVSEIEQCLNH